MNSFLDRIVADKLKENKDLFTPESLKEFRDRIDKRAHIRSLKAASGSNATAGHYCGN